MGVFVLIILAGIYKFDYLSGLDGYDVDGNKIVPNEFNNKINGETADFQRILETNKEITTKSMEVKIPTWKFDETKKDFVIEFSKYKVPQTKAILNATLKKLFRLKGGDAWNGMSFDFAKIENKKAIVEMSGQILFAGDMSGAAMKNELEAAVFQFKNIKFLEVRLNGKIFDWCVDDESNGGGGCPEQKRLWIVEK